MILRDRRMTMIFSNNFAIFIFSNKKDESQSSLHSTAFNGTISCSTCKKILQMNSSKQFLNYDCQKVHPIRFRTLELSKCPWLVMGSIYGLANKTQCRQLIATAAMFLRSCVVQALNRGISLVTRHTLRRNAASIMS